MPSIGNIPQYYMRPPIPTDAKPWFIAALVIFIFIFWWNVRGKMAFVPELLPERIFVWGIIDKFKRLFQ